MNEFAHLPEIVMRVRRADGTWSARPVWVVVVDGHAYVRAAFGHRSIWYRAVLSGAEAAVQVDDASYPARLEPVGDPELIRRVSEGYRAKYGLSWPGPVESMIASEVAVTTMRLQIEIAELPA